MILAEFCLGIVCLFILCVMHISAGEKNLMYKMIIFRDIGNTKSNVTVRELQLHG